MTNRQLSERVMLEPGLLRSILNKALNREASKSNIQRVITTVSSQDTATSITGMTSRDEQIG